MKIAKAHCFFEQSGTFRDEFIKLGIPAEDYDIKNDFGKTDHIIDLFGEITAAYGGGTSVFDNVGKDDLIFAFFPCVRFSDNAKLTFSGHRYGLNAWSKEKCLEHDIEFHSELHDLYCLVTKLALICFQKDLRLVIENPYGAQHYLVNYWALKPSIIDKDRTLNGDYYKKPTQFFFVNCEPEQNFIFESVEYSKPRNVEHAVGENGLKREVIRSLIHPQYARRFIKMYLLDQEAALMTMEKTTA